MADQKDEKTGVVPARALRSAKEFVAAHGEPVRAVVENIGQAGARVVLVGADGLLGDVIVPGVAAGEALVAQLPDTEAAEWDRETVAAVKIGAAHRRKMAGPRARA